MASATASKLARAERLVAFLNQSPSPFHAVEAVRQRLASVGFVELKERERWKLEPNGRYYFTRNRSTIVAFAVGGRYRAGNGFAIIGAHTDSPCLKVKPQAKVESQGYLQLGVQVYGGGIWHTWFDRDLGLAGRAMVRDSKGGLQHRLVRVHAPIAHIPTLAIHLERSVNTEGFKFNLEKELLPILGLSPPKKSSKEEPQDDKAAAPPASMPAPILKLLAEELHCAQSDFSDVELCLYDLAPACLGGLEKEFVFAARLDNLYNAHTATEALIESVTDEDGGLSQDENVRMIALFDHEEIGSQSAYGAASLLLESTLRRISADEGNPTSFEEAAIRSFLISADQAHAVHPNYAYVERSKHEDNHRPRMNQGVVIKQNANQRYATTAATAAFLRILAQKAEVPLQIRALPDRLLKGEADGFRERDHGARPTGGVGKRRPKLQDFVVRNDMGCGSTIGPILSSGLGMRTIDVGCPQLSMHSIRETGGSHDVAHAVGLFKAFFKHFGTLDPQVEVD